MSDCASSVIYNSRDYYFIRVADGFFYFLMLFGAYLILKTLVKGGNNEKK
jgi:hypothetical protein